MPNFERRIFLHYMRQCRERLVDRRPYGDRASALKPATRWSFEKLSALWIGGTQELCTPLLGCRGGGDTTTR